MPCFGVSLVDLEFLGINSLLYFTSIQGTRTGVPLTVRVGPMVLNAGVF